jgi:serine/threonine protein kinase
MVSNVVNCIQVRLLTEYHLAIAALHKKKYLHRDISMKNILIDDSGEETNGLRNGLLIDFDYAIHDLDNREVGGLHRTVCPLHVPYPIRTVRFLTDRSQGTIPYMAVQLLTELNKVKHELYHDLESLFYVMCYNCCINAGPDYTIREDLNVYETAIVKWFGTKEQSESQIGVEKYKTVDAPSAFKKSILAAFHPYFNPLKSFMQELRDIAIPPHSASVDLYRRMKDLEEDDVENLPLYLKPMEVRGEEQLKEYRDIVQAMFNSLPVDHPRPGGSSPANHDSPNTAASEAVRSPKSRMLQPIIGDDILLRLMDLVPQQGLAPQDKQQNVGETQDEAAKGSATLVGRGSSGSRSGKRKSAALEEGEPESDESEGPQSPTPVGKGSRIQDTCLRGSSGLHSLTALGGSSKTALDSITEILGLEGPAEISGDVRRSGSKDTKRPRTREELDG